MINRGLRGTRGDGAGGAQSPLRRFLRNWSGRGILCGLTLVLLAPAQNVPAQAAGAVTLTWDANQESDLAGYKLYASTSPGAYAAPIATLPKDVTTERVTGLQTDTTYYFVVTSFDTSGNESGPSNEVSAIVRGSAGTVTVPSVVGALQAEAEAMLSATGLAASSVAVNSSQPATQVLAQDPAAGTLVSEGSVVTLDVSTGPVLVPDVVGLAQTDAAAALVAAGLSTGNLIPTSHPTAPEGEVINQVPAAEASVAPGITVDLVVSSGPSATSKGADQPAGEGGDGGGCFVATAAYGTPLAEEVQTLRVFRDRYLITNEPGRLLVTLYYSLSPPVARIIAGHESLREATRITLVPVVWWAELALISPVIAILIGFGLLGSGLALCVVIIRRRLFVFW